MARLIDLRPEWYSHRALFPRIHVGLVFDCPCGPKVGRRLTVFFDPEIDPAGWNQNAERVAVAREWMWWRNMVRHQRVGDTFETLTLTPSIVVAGYWHGHITNGIVTSD